MYSRREFGKLALASLPLSAAELMLIARMVIFAQSHLM